MGIEINKPLQPAQEAATAPLGWGRERPLFAGLFTRVSAFLLDAATLFIIAMLVTRLARPLLLALNPALPWLAHLPVFLYFWLLQGPLGGGRTVGKMVMRIRVADGNGEAIGWGPAARRALLQSLAFLYLIAPLDPLLPQVFNPLDYLIAFPPQARMSAYFVLAILPVLGASWGVTQMLCIFTHPQHRSWCDLAACSYVTSARTPDDFKSNINDWNHDELERDFNNFRKFMPIFFVLSFVVLMITPAKQLTNEESLTAMREMIALQESQALKGYDLVSVVDPSDVRDIYLIQQMQHIRGGDFNPQAIPTTATLVQALGHDGRGQFALALRSHGGIDEAMLASDVLRGQVEALRSELWQRSERKRRERIDSDAGYAPPSAERFELLLAEPLRLVVFSSYEFRAHIAGPADPEAGPLTFRWIDDYMAFLRERGEAARAMSETAEKNTTQKTDTQEPATP